MDGGDWISLAGVVVSAGSAGWAIWSAKGANDAKAAAQGAQARAEQDAARAIRAAEKAAVAEAQSAAAAERAAAALEKQNQLTADRFREVSKLQARQVIVREHVRNGRKGLVVHNEGDNAVYQLYVDLVGRPGQLEMASTRDVVPVPAGVVFQEVLPGHDGTWTHSIFVWPSGPEDSNVFLAGFRVRFRDSAGVWWQRKGNSDPEQIDPLG